MYTFVYGYQSWNSIIKYIFMYPISKYLPVKGVYTNKKRGTCSAKKG